MNISELLNILKKKNINISARKISEIWGIDEASFSRKKRLGSEIKYENIKQLEQELNINITLNDNQKPDVEIINIPYWEGIPEQLKRPNPTPILYTRQIIEGTWGLKPENLCLVPMIGNGMVQYWYPIKNNDTLIVDTHQNKITARGVYFATSKNNTIFWIREMQTFINGDIEVKEYSTVGETTNTYTLQQLKDADFRLIGRVIENASFRL